MLLKRMEERSEYSQVYMYLENVSLVKNVNSSFNIPSQKVETIEDYTMFYFWQQQLIVQQTKFNYQLELTF